VLSTHRPRPHHHILTPYRAPRPLPSSSLTRPRSRQVHIRHARGRQLWAWAVSTPLPRLPVPPGRILADASDGLPLKPMARDLPQILLQWLIKQVAGSSGAVALPQAGLHHGRRTEAAVSRSGSGAWTPRQAGVATGGVSGPIGPDPAAAAIVVPARQRQWSRPWPEVHGRRLGVSHSSWICRAARPVAVARGGPCRATSIGVVYLLLPLVSGKVDWCSIKFVVSLSCEVTNKDMRHCHSCEDVDLLQSKDGPMCRCMLKNYVICTPHNSMFYAVSDFLDLNANSPLNRRDGSIVSYKTHFKARYQLSLYSFIFSLLYLLSCRIILLCILFVYTFTRRGLNFFYEDQPLLFATKLFKARNFLHNCHYIKEKGFFLTRMIVVSAF
jgi:hypothetical protein